MPFIQQYDIPANPFELRELKPLVSPSDTKLLDEISKSAPAYAELVAVDDYLKLNAASGKPLFFLVKGLDGCGRSSVANWILARYSKYRGIDPANFIVPDTRTFGDNDPLSVLYEITGMLLNDIDERDIAGIDVDKLRETRDAAKTNSDLSRFQNLARSVAKQLDPLNPPPGRPPLGYGVCIEKVRVPAIVKNCFSAFSKAPSICVFDVGDYGGEKKNVIDFFEGYQEQPLQKQSVSLHVLDAVSLREIVHTRWKFTTAKPIPFPPNLEQAFPGTDYTVKRVVVLINEVLDYKSRVFPNMRWNANKELGVEINELTALIGLVEKFGHLEPVK